MSFKQVGLFKNQKSENVQNIIKEYNLIYKCVDNIIKELQTESEALAGGLALSPSLSYGDYQLNQLEEVFETYDLDSFEPLRELMLTEALTSVDRKARMMISYALLKMDLAKLKSDVEDFITLSDEDVCVLRDSLTSNMGNIIYGLNNYLRIRGCYKHKVVDANLNLVCTEEGVDPEDWMKERLELNRTKYKPILGQFSNCPDLWEDFINDVPPDSLDCILTYSDSVTVNDIVKFNRGELVIDGDYEELLQQRDSKYTESHPDDTEEVSKESSIVNFYKHYDETDLGAFFDFEKEME